MKHPIAACMALFIGTTVTASSQKTITTDESSSEESDEKGMSAQGSTELEEEH